MIFLTVWLLTPAVVRAAEEGREPKGAGEKLLDNLELEEMQNTVNELLGEDTFNIKETLLRLLRGEEVFSKEVVQEILKEFLYRSLFADKKTLLQILLLLLLASVFSNFTGVFENAQTGEASFYIVYMLLLTLLFHSFGNMSMEISESLKNSVTFMQALMPSYFLAVTAASGSTSAMVFYEMVFAAVYVVQNIMIKAVIPAVHGYVLLQGINFLYPEDFLSKMADFVKTTAEWTLHTCTAVIIGMQIVQNMISPAVDSLKRDMLGKAASALPGIGNAIEGAAGVALAAAVLIRNALGVAGILVLAVLALPPVIRLAATALAYKFLAALVQPVSDKRMTGCLSTMGEGCRLLLKVLLTAELLMLITITVLSVSFTGH